MGAVSLYIYLVNDFFYFIIVRNNINNFVIISKYLRLSTVLEINYNNYLFIIRETIDLVIAPALEETF